MHITSLSVPKSPKRAYSRGINEFIHNLFLNTRHVLKEFLSILQRLYFKSHIPRAPSLPKGWSSGVPPPCPLCGTTAGRSKATAPALAADTAAPSPRRRAGGGGSGEPEPEGCGTGREGGHSVAWRPAEGTAEPPSRPRPDAPPTCSLGRGEDGAGGLRRAARAAAIRPQDRSQEAPWRKPRRGWVRLLSPRPRPHTKATAPPRPPSPPAPPLLPPAGVL